MKITITLDTDYFTPFSDGFNTYHELFQSLVRFMPRRADVTEILIEEYPMNTNISPYYCTPRDKFIR